MKVTVRYFASLREALGQSVESVDTTAQTLAQLREELMARDEVHASALAMGKSVRMALNQVMADGQAALTPGCEVAFFPPVTGG